VAYVTRRIFAENFAVCDSNSGVYYILFIIFERVLGGSVVVEKSELDLLLFERHRRIYMYIRYNIISCIIMCYNRMYPHTYTRTHNIYIYIYILILLKLNTLSRGGCRTILANVIISSRRGFDQISPKVLIVSKMS